MVQVRFARREEITQVYPLFRGVVEAEGAEVPGPAQFARTWSWAFRPQTHFRFVVGEEAGQLVALMSLHRHFSTWKAAPTVSLEDFFVLPDWRGKGIGTAMLRFAENHAAGLGAARIELDVRRDNERAVALYARQGFVEQPYRWMHKPIVAARAAQKPPVQEPRKTRRAGQGARQRAQGRGRGRGGGRGRR